MLLVSEDTLSTDTFGPSVAPLPGDSGRDANAEKWKKVAESKAVL